MTDSDRSAVDRAAGPEGSAVDGPVEPEELVLAGGFDPVTRDQWLAAADAVVRKSGRIGEDAELGAGVETLTRTSPDGIRVAPLYADEDTTDLPPTGVPGSWPFTRGARARFVGVASEPHRGPTQPLLERGAGEFDEQVSELIAADPQISAYVRELKRRAFSQ